MILEAGEWQEFSGRTLTDAQLASVQRICIQVSAAIARKCRPWLFEPQTFTDKILDAPLDQVLVLPYIPVRSITSIYLNWIANGDTTLFTSDYLLTNYTDYLLDVNDHVNGWSTTGRVFHRRYAGWGGERRFPAERLAGVLEPIRGAIKITYLAGMTAVPEDVKMAAELAVSMVYERRVTGSAITSNSWNGESVSYGTPYTAEAAVNSPDVAALLASYTRLAVGVP